MRKALLPIMIILFTAGMAWSLSDEQIRDLKRYEKHQWKQFYAWAEERQNYMDFENYTYDSPEYKKYQELTQKMDKARSKIKQYKKVQQYETGTLKVIKDTVVWSAQDFREMAKIMWESNRELFSNFLEKKWTDILKSTYDAMFRMKIRKMVKNTMNCNAPLEEFEKKMMDELINPQVEKSQAWQAIEKGADKGIEKLKEKYAEKVKERFMQEFKKKAKGMSKSQIQAMSQTVGKQVLDKASAAIDAAQFTLDIAQKLYFWNEYVPLIQDQVDQLALVKDKYKKNGHNLSCEDSFAVWTGKKKIDPVQQKPDKTEKTSDVNNTGKDDVPELDQDKGSSDFDYNKLNPEQRDIYDRIAVERKKAAYYKSANLVTEYKDVMMKIKLLTEMYVEKGGDARNLE